MFNAKKAIPRKTDHTLFEKYRTTGWRLGITVTVGLLAYAFPTFADGFEGANLLSGATGRIIEVNSHKIVENVDPDAIGLPKKFLIDLKAKQMRPSKESIIRKTISFKRIEQIENTIILQGIDDGVQGVNDGLAWSLTLSKKNGSAVLAASGDGVAYVVFGTIVPVE